MFYSLAKTAKIFSAPGASPLTVESLHTAAAQGKIPPPSQGKEGRRSASGWTGEQIGHVGAELGYLHAASNPLVYCVFVTKGGVLKTTLTLNLARTAALHGIRTLVVGLDMQCDVTTALGYQPATDDSASLSDAFNAMDSTNGLTDYFRGDAGLEDIIQRSDLKFLDFIPETPELVALDQQLMARSRREYWLSDKVIGPLKQRYDLILLDCSPNWNHLITNALVASDVLISPIECRINNYRNLKMFRGFIEQFRGDLDLSFRHIFVPTRLAPGRKLSREIFEWYQSHIPGCLKLAVREGVQGEEASALHLSVPEYAPGHKLALEMSEILREIWTNQGTQRPTQRRQPGVSPWL